MLTATEIKQQIEDLKEQALTVSKTHNFHSNVTAKRRYGRIGKQIEHLQTLLLYVENNPSEEYLKKEQGRIKTRMKLVDDGFGDWVRSQNGKGLDMKQLKAEYQKLNDYSTLKRHLKNVQFLLSSAA